jgi:phosphopantothenoylcysteine decarboxylase / phosphopantothenate---cysteine ligase
MTTAKSDHFGKRLTLGVSGGIAAYKTAELVRLFRKAGAEVQVVMTPSATRFVTPLTLGTLSEREVYSEIFPPNEDGSWTRHVQIGLWSDLFIIAPATAQTIAKLATGMCDSMLTAVALAARCPILVCPSMDHDMYEHQATRENLDRLREIGYLVMDPDVGSLASGLVGKGRLPEPDTIFDRAGEILERAKKEESGLLAGKKVLVTAGPTRERIDPVRFLSNHSTGTMGFEIAAAAARRGASVVLVSGPTTLETPENVLRVDIESAAEMNTAVQKHADADVIIMAAAVADFTPTTTEKSKIKKGSSTLSLQLESTTDILAGVGEHRRPDQILVGFALETDDGLENARGKLLRKNLDWIVLNNPEEEGAGFGTSTNRVTLIPKKGSPTPLPILEKRIVADTLIDAISGIDPPELD